jgi:futalosine hydrolase
MRHSPARAVFLGTAGAVPGAGLAIGDVVVARAHRLVDTAVLEHRGAMPFSPEGPAPDPILLERLVAFGARAVVVATSPSVTTDDSLAAKLAGHHDCAVEHLEAFAFARACAALGVPAAVVLGIANVVGSAGRAEWRAHHVEASARAGELLARAVADLRT